jgi:hypothetical protein
MTLFASLRNWPVGELSKLPADFIRSHLMSAPPGAFDKVSAFCMFVGHSRSGHSLLASLLDAHRNIVLADEIHSLKYVAAGFSPMAIYKLILRNSLDISAKGRERAGYQFSIPDQWQGRHETIRVIGEKDGSWTATLALRNFHVIETLFARIPLDIRIIHLYRNPYDVISTIYRRYRAAGKEWPLQHAIDFYFRRAEGIEIVRRYGGRSRVLDMSHESLIADTQARVALACGFLSVDTPDDYLRACAQVTFPSPRKSRQEAVWTMSEVDQVRERKAGYSYLADYSFEG